MKKISYNLKFANSKLIWCIITLFTVLSFAMKVDCSDGVSKSIITLPKAESGIEKLEYIVNGEPKGSTNGINSIELEPGAKVNFAVKFQSEGYSKLHVRGVKINSENGSVLRLNTYDKDDEGNFVLMRVQDSELIDPNQTYISSDYVVGKDDKLSFEGIEEDKYCVKIADENDDVNLFDAVGLKYSQDGDNYVDAEFSENEKAFIINGVTKSSDVKLMFEIREGYTNSNLSLVNGAHQIAIDGKSKSCTLPELKSDTDLEIKNLEKNSYNVTFNEYTNARFSYRSAGSSDEFKSSETVKVYYGDSLEIKCETDSDDILSSGEVTVNGKTIVANNGVYALENIKDNSSIAITPKGSALYSISLPANEDKIKLCDTSGNEVSEINTLQNNSVDFKIVPGDAYKKNFILAEMYAVPISKLSNGDYDITANREEAKSFLMLPSGDYIYTLKNVTEPVKIIATGMEKSVYTVTLPDQIVGAKAEVETNENVTQLTENKFKVVHGSDLVVNLEAKPGYDLSTIKAADVDNSLEIIKDENKYTFKNIDDDKYIIINGASTAMCKISFDGKDVIATSESGTDWKDNIALVRYQEGTLKFKVRPADGVGSTDDDVSLSVKSGHGNLTKVSSEKNTYLISGVTGDVVLRSSMAKSSDVTITLKSDDEDLQFTNANDESIVLPEENTVKYGTDLDFKVVSKSGKSTDNASVVSSVSNPVVASNTSSNTYSVTALRSGETRASSNETDDRKTANYIDLCETLHVYTEVAPPEGSEEPSTWEYKSYTGPDNPTYNSIPLFNGNWNDHILVFSKDPQLCECINADTTVRGVSTQQGSNSVEIWTPNYTSTVFGLTQARFRLNLAIPAFMFGSGISLGQNLSYGTPWNLSEHPFAIFFEKNLTNSDPFKTYMEGCSVPTGSFPNRDDGIVLPDSIYSHYLYDYVVQEKNAGDYYDVKTKEQIPGVPQDSSRILQYLKDCYCNSFTELYPQVTLQNGAVKDKDKHNSNIQFSCSSNNISPKQGVDNAFTVNAYSEHSENSNEYSFNLGAPAEVKFKIALDRNKKFADGVTEPLCLNEGAHAKITEQVIVSDQRNCYVQCTLLVTPYDENVQLKWSENSEIITRQCNITFISKDNGTTFRNGKGSDIRSDTVNAKEGYTFSTEPTEGHTFSDSLKIEVNDNTYMLDSIAKIYVENSDEGSGNGGGNGDNGSGNSGENGENGNNNGRTRYNGEWIKLGGNSDNDTALFIRGTLEDTHIKYEIAGTDPETGENPPIEEYIVHKEQQQDAEPNTVIYEKEKNTVVPSGVVDDLTITAERPLVTRNVTFSYAEGIEYWPNAGTEPMSSVPVEMRYGEALVFKVVAKEGYDISDMQVMASTDKNTHILNLTNGVYVITKITDNTTISVSGVKKSSISLSFEQHEGITYRNSSGGEYLLRQQVPYNEEIAFQIDVSEGYSQAAKDIEVNLIYPNSNPHEEKPFADSPSTDPSSPRPYIQNNLYIIPAQCVNQDIKIDISDLEANEYSVSLTPSQGIEYIEPSGSGNLPVSPALNEGITYGNSFKFRLNAADGYDISNIEVVAKASSGNSSPITLIPANGIYTIENITSDYTVTVSGVSKQRHTIEFRTVTGVACLDAYGKTLPSSVTVADGENYSFYLSFDSAYSKSKDTADVTIKGSNNKVPHDSSGKYTLSNINEDKIVEIINVTKNSYTATFVPAEGVVYRTAKGKEFNGTLNVEYGESLYFKLSLLDAYDQSIPNVKMNGTKDLVENSGSYVLENISDDVTVTVENVEKNPEELTIEDIQKVPDPVTNEDDVNAVVAATKAYNSLSDEDKKLVTNKPALEKAQSEAGDINHTSNGVSISGVDWNVKLVVTPLNDNQEEMKAFEEKVERRSVLSLYKAELIDLLTGESYDIPYGKEVQITMPCPDLTGYKNVTVAHENLSENMEYLDPNIVDNTAKFSATSVGLFGIAAKEIPNYSEDTSDMSISMGELVADDNELKSLLGEDLSSQLGHLIDLEDENDSKDNDSNKNGNGSSDGTNGSDSLMNDMAGGAASLANSVYNWALDNEFLAVTAILALGSLLILIILLTNRKKDDEQDNIKKRKQ